MKRSIGSLLLAATAAGAFAQANFTIVRPVDGSRVREKVKIQFPLHSIPAGAYVGIFLNGQLIDATVPPVVGNYRQYTLDTKGRGLPDTPSGKPDHLEAKLYVDYNGQPRILRTSAIDFNIANVASIRVPMGGFRLRYRFTPGTQTTYKIIQKSVVSTISETENGKGGRPAELPVDAETYRMTYAVDNAYPNGDGLVRMQPAPNKGKEYAVVTVAGEDAPRKVRDEDMASVYMRLTSTGKEVFGSIPDYFPMDGTSGAGGSGLDAYLAVPLPSLPEKAVRPGDSWQSRFQTSKIDMNKLHAQTSVVSTSPARGEFVGVEWEMGHPCAKIHNVIAVATQTDDEKKLDKKGAAFAGKRQKVDETIWFAMDTRQVIKVIRDQTVETKIDTAGAGSPFGGAPGEGSGGGYPGMAPGRGAGGSRGSVSTDFDLGPVGLRQQSGSAPPPPMDPRGGGRLAPTGGQYPGGMGSGRGPMGGGRMGAPGSGGPEQNTVQYLRVRTQQIFILEQ